MRHLFTRTLMLFMPLALSLTMAAHAQSAAIIKVSIPFAFNFGDQTFPAGDYSLVQPLQNYLVLRNSRGEAVAQTLTLGVDAQTPAGDTELRFEASGDQHILTEVWQKQDSSGQRLYPAKSRTSVPRE